MALARGRSGSVARRISSQAQRCSSPGCVLFRCLSPTRRCSCSCFSFDSAVTCPSTRGGNLAVAGARALFCSGLGTVDDGVTAAAVRRRGTGVPGDRRAMTGVEGSLGCEGEVLSGPQRLHLSLPPPGAAAAVGVCTAATATAGGPCLVGGGDVSSATSIFPPQPRFRRRDFDIVGIRWRSGARWRAVGGGYLEEEEKGIGQWRSFATEPNPPPKEHLRYIHRANPAQSSEQTYATAHEVPMSPLDRLVGTSQEEAFEGGEGSIDHRNGEELAAEASSTDGTRKWLKGFTAEDILRDKSRLRQQLEVRGNCTVDEAITIFVNQKATSFLVVNQRKEVIGMFTSRDLLSELARYPNKADGLKIKARDFMIPLNRMIYCSMKDSLYQCLLVMSELKVRNLPVVSEGKVMGIVNVNDISDFSFSMEEIGGKKAFMNNVSQRKGLPKGVGLDPKQNRAGWKQTFSASVGTVALPHPHKLADGRVSANKREHRHLAPADDPSLSEDAHFVIDVAWPTETTDTVNYVGIADGVGSWRRVGVDPREFSRRLMHWAREYILSMAPGPEIDDGRVHRQLSPRPPKPHEVLQAAWEYTIGEKVVGSSTACVAALDYDLEQLTFSNIGDCGVVVLRHIDSDVVGYMREKQTPRHLRDSDLRLAFISQQQLRSFNLPYQFGYTNIPEHNANFETPRDAVNTSFPVRPGDIILLATDGLFDNMELDDICAVALDWEYKWFGGPMMGLGDHNNAALEDLALQLGHRARELSLDDTRDSPFALLAKENDVMWGGGMPDDITVVALRVVNKVDSQAAAVSTRGLRFDDQHDVMHKNDQHQDDAEASG